MTESQIIIVRNVVALLIKYFRMYMQGCNLEIADYDKRTGKFDKPLRN